MPDKDLQESPGLLWTTRNDSMRHLLVPLWYRKVGVDNMDFPVPGENLSTAQRLGLCGVSGDFDKTTLDPLRPSKLPSDRIYRVLSGWPDL